MNPFEGEIQLKNELMELRPLQLADFEALFCVASDPLIWEQHPQPDRYKKEVFEKTFFEGAVASSSSFLIFSLPTNELVGSTRYYDYDESVRKVAIGYTFIARKYWGGNFNSSLKKLMLDYAFRFVEQVDFHVGLRNYRSQKAVEKLGAVKVEEHNDNLTYCLTKSDYLAKFE